MEAKKKQRKEAEERDRRRSDLPVFVVIKINDKNTVVIVNKVN